MTPQQIAEVASSWHEARSRPEELRAAIVLALPPGPLAPGTRADWIIETVDRLQPLLPRPNQLAAEAVETARGRTAVTSADLAADREALLAGLVAATGRMSATCREAWLDATALFGDVIASLICNPFTGGSPSGR